MKKRIVLDTNCLISSLSRTSDSYEVWKGLHEGRYILESTGKSLNVGKPVAKQAAWHSPPL